MRKSNSRLELEEVRILIAERAYYKSEADGHPNGREDHYWILAEKEVLRELENSDKTKNGKPASQPAAVKKAPARSSAAKKDTASGSAKKSASKKS